MKYHLLDKSGATYVDVHLHRPVSGVAILKPNLSLGFLLAIWTRWPNNNVNEKVAKNVKSQVDQVSLEPFLSAAKRLQVSIVVSDKSSFQYHALALYKFQQPITRFISFTELPNFASESHPL